MSNFALCFENQADTATLSGGNYTVGLPRDNAKDYRLGKKARTVTTATTDTLMRFAFGAAVYVQAVALIATNASPNATFRVRLFSDAAFSVVVYDSTALTLYPSGSMPNSQIPAGAPNAGTGKPTAAEVSRFQNNINHLLSAPQYAQYGEIAITDTANSAGYLEIGRLFVGRVFQPAKNPEYGAASLALTSRTELVEAFDGTPYFTYKKPRYSIPAAFKWLTQDEAMRALDIQAIADVSGEVLVIWDPTDVAYWWRRQLFGRLKQLDPIQYPLFSTYSGAFQVEGPLS